MDQLTKVEVTSFPLPRPTEGVSGCSLSGRAQLPNTPSHTTGAFPNISASLSSFGCRPSRIASTMSLER